MLRTQITLGIIMMMVTIGTMAYIGATEENRMKIATEAQLARKIENGAAIFHSNCITCHGERAEGVPGLCPPLNSLTLLEQRVKETGWSGSVHNYIVSTIRGGRLTSTRPNQYVGESATGMAMPFWGQDFGGPLRNDQIEDVAYYLENFGKTAVAAKPTATPIPADTPPEKLVEIGLELYKAQGCAGCHKLAVANAAGATGPTHDGLAATAAERIKDAKYKGSAKTAEEYIAESIQNPTAFVVDGFQPVMPAYNLPPDQLNAMVKMLASQK